MSARTLRNDRREARYQSMSDSTYGPPGEGGTGPDGRIDYAGKAAAAGTGLSLSASQAKASFAPKDALKYF